LSIFNAPFAGLFGGGVQQVQNDPGVIIGPIATFFGWIIDIIFNAVYAVTTHGSLGISIILLTIVVRLLMLPLAAKQQKSMVAMQKLQPEVEKIRKKYGNSKDPEIQRKMNIEIQGLYTQNKVNPLGGCLPLLIQMPIFFGLYQVMNRSFAYVTKLGQVYDGIAGLLHRIPGYTNYVVPLALPHVPKNMLDDQALDISRVPDMTKVLNKFSITDWDTLFSQLPREYLTDLNTLYEQKLAIERIFGMALTENAGLMWPGILIPFLAVVTTLATSYISSRMNTSTDERVVMQQRVMMIMMPIMMGFMTVNMPAGVGVYWITSSVFQVAQQAVMNKRAGFPLFGKKQVTEVK
jgi:YidC/Oxa1 family membrane protein insertase